MSTEAHLERISARTARNPEHADARYDLGIVLAHLGRSAEALEEVRKALAINPEFEEASLTACFLLGETAGAAEGLRAFRRLPTQSADSFTATFALGVYLMRHGWTRDGLAQLLRAEFMGPPRPDVLLAAARAHSDLGEAAAARARRERALAMLREPGMPEPIPSNTEALGPAQGGWRDPGFCRVPMVIADVHMAEGRPDEAIRELRAALQGPYPAHPRILAHLGMALRRAGRPDEAERWLMACTRVDPACHQALVELGFVAIEREEPRRAVSAFQAAVRLRPLFPDYRYHLATLLLGQRRVEEAIAEFRLALAIHPSYGEAAMQLAGAILAQGEPDEVLRLLAAPVWGHWPESLVVSAEALILLGREPEAQALLQEALALDPAFTEAHKLLEGLRSPESHPA